MKTNEQLDKEAYPVVAFFILVGAIVWGILLAVSWANAATTLNFQWTANADMTVGYKILMDEGDNVILDVPGIASTTGSYVLDDDTVLHVFSIVAYNSSGDESKQGAMVAYVPEEEAVPGAPKQYLLTLEPIE